ncbi:acyl-CoA dehydratase activase [Desulfoferrobacter suflitae]|uniref:acyl-CoA dehydratase activase n=1 Tax=Desulfoferrobacter suflitae TaxID=2865782 RepID=UPI002164EF6B|nr:acyl-CoA dehydratase activase [Desulfoferrobacter suflitae]MCK8600533.1 acyl-CoA dehydratase activase [Desulfoferrobacter suflitae]
MVYDVGVDVGSVSINCVVVDKNQQIVYVAPYLRHYGLVFEETHALLKNILRPTFFPGSCQIRSVSFTGVQGQVVAELLSAPWEVETIAQVLGVTHVVPGVRTIISIGGQDAALFQLAHDGDQWQLEAFNMNGPCASGTGSFIDQQAERLTHSIYGSDFDMDQEKHQRTLDDFIALGLQSTYPAPVACRCTVFTKSDMIHLQNKGETLPNIIAGLHHGNAANYMSTIVANRDLYEPIVFIGGIASNRLQVQAFRHYFPQLKVPPHHTALGALGVSLQAQKQGWTNTVDLARLGNHHKQSRYSFPKAERLELKLTHFDPDNSLSAWTTHRKNPVKAYLGVDIGSTTTKYALMDDDGQILNKCYVPTQGKPIEVTQKLLRNLCDEMQKHVRLMAIATTGSGRNVVGDFLKADLVIDEITAHARGAVAIDPQVDTIFEIGGQDSKYIRIDNTHPLDFDMNKVCAAGTGSFLHELANKLKINIVGEFQEIALSAKTPIHLAERCTVFMESDLVSYAQKGAEREDLIAGLCYAIVYNYLNRVVEKRYVGERIMFLGGPSLNQGIVAAFEKVTGKPILVPKHREVMGAYGAALAVRELLQKGDIAQQARDLEKLSQIQVNYTETVCKADKKCHNECKLKVYSFGGRKSVWGGDCGRYEVSRYDGAQQPNFFQERQQLFQEVLEEKCLVSLEAAKPENTSKPTIGVPLALHTLEWGILWGHLFAELGWPVRFSPKTNNRLVLSGLESMTAETCFPVKVFHGHVRHLLEECDYLFLPNVINMPTPTAEETGFFCPLVESSQYMVRAALRIPDDRMIRPTLYLKEGQRSLIDSIYRSFPERLRPERVELERAFEKAWNRQVAFRARLIQRGNEILQQTSPSEPLWIITGRPYNLYDERLNLQLGKHLAKLGIKALPMDFLYLDAEDLSDYPRMYWGLGAKILRTAKRIARTPNWYGLHLTNFSCGADSFIEHFYRHILGDKPSLILELDEHSAVAGVMTRLEAYKNVVKNLQERYMATMDYGIEALG